MNKVFIHGSGHKAASWEETIAHMKKSRDIQCPELSSLLKGKETKMCIRDSFRDVEDKYGRYHIEMFCWQKAFTAILPALT